MKNKGSKKTWLIVTIIAIIAVLIVGYLMNRGLNKNYVENGSKLETADSSKESNKNKKEKKTKEELEKEKEEEEKEIVKGSNHIKKAADYVYDTKEIREYTRNKKEYDGKKLVFLTFDDGANHKITPQILDILKEKDAKGTFFVLGKNVNENTKDVLERELEEGHAIAMHSFGHDYAHLYPGRVANKENILSDLEKTDSALKEILGEDFKSGVWRYPGGHMSWKGLEATDEAMEEKGVAWIDWNSLSGDAEPKSRRPETAAGMVEFTEKSLQMSGQTDIAVVLMHDAENKTQTVEALPKIIDYFKDNGYEFGILK